MKVKTIGIALVIFSVALLAILVLIKNGVDSESAALCEFYHEKSLDMNQCPAHKNSLSWLITGLFGMVFLIMGTGAFLIFTGENKPIEQPKPTEKVDIGKLEEDEKVIYESVKQGSGSKYQSDLIKETGMSKVKITRVLDKMESKGIIERKRRGMTNIIVLK